MKYLILMYGSQQDYDAMAGNAGAGEPAWSAAEFAAMGAFMESFGTGPGRIRGTGRRAGPDRPGAHPQDPAAGGRPGGDRRPLRRDRGGPGRLLARRLRQLRPGHRDRRPVVELPRPGPHPRAGLTWTSGRSPSPGPTWSPDRGPCRGRGRGPAPPAGAAGPRRAGAAVRALRHRRGRGAGGAAGGRHPVARRRSPGQPARLADHGRLPPADRPAAQRAGRGAPARRRPPGGSRRGSGWPRRPTPRPPSRTTRSSCCSCAATPRCRPPRRSR